MTVRFNPETREGVSHLAKLTNRSRSYIINQAVQMYLVDKLAYLQALNEAVESIETKQTFSAKAVFDWIHSWKTNGETVYAIPQSIA